MIPGLGGLPKMSKSIPGSGLDASMPADDIRALVSGDRDTSGEDEGSALLQMYACLPEVDGASYDRAAAAAGPAPASGGYCARNSSNA